MRVYGSSILKGLMYTLKTFVGTYVEDFKGGSKTFEEHGLRSVTEGAVTVQYPESPMPIGSTYERFRVLPMLVYDQKEDGEKDVRCTSCGICAKVCPPQCIWIVQEMDEKNKPVPNPEEFFIDTSVCMNCGLCSEFCPFDAIKMDHQFALNVTENRQENYLYDLEKLLVPAEYYAELHPKANAAEEEARRLEAEAKAKKAAEKAERLAAKKKAAAEAPAAGDDAEKPVKKASAAADDPERAARIAAAKEKAAAAKAKREAEKAAAAEGGAETDASAEPQAAPADDPERAARIAAAKEKAAAAKAKREAEKAAAAEAQPIEAQPTETESTEVAEPADDVKEKDEETP
jgi:NADH-quinone oxidoreductase subunit I